jgi:hypothetical protein
MFAEGTCPRASITGETYDTETRTVDTKRASLRKNNVTCNIDSNNFSADLSGDNAAHPHLYKHQQKDTEFFQDKASIVLSQNTGCISESVTGKYT